mmetsp:Transcript_10498/g.43449  ORF Transcript_10498/g.43449 Transcript_10498/m.43449 type:complete len:282 (-) Transcript_10498:414-1259(-)
MASLHSSAPGTNKFSGGAPPDGSCRTGRSANDSWYVPRFKPQAARTFSNLSGAWTMNLNAGSVLPSTTALRPTLSVIGESFRSSASGSLIQSMELAGFCALSAMVRPSCMHSASCVFVSSFADTAAPMVLVAWTRRLSRRLAFFARLFVSFRAFFSRFASNRVRVSSSISSSFGPPASPSSDRRPVLLRLDSALRKDLRNRGEPSPAMPPFETRGEAGADPGRESGERSSSPASGSPSRSSSSSPDMEPTDSASSSPSCGLIPRTRTALTRGVTDAEELPE